MERKYWGIFGAAAIIVASCVAAPYVENALNNVKQFAVASREATERDHRRLNADVGRVNAYTDALEAHKNVTPQDTAQCRAAIKDLYAFVAEGEHPTGIDYGKQERAEAEKKELDSGDHNPCPTLPEFQKLGTKAFALIEKPKA